MNTNYNDMELAASNSNSNEHKSTLMFDLNGNESASASIYRE